MMVFLLIFLFTYACFGEKVQSDANPKLMIMISSILDISGFECTLRQWSFTLSEWTGVCPREH
jgi:hypothetical protein